MGILRIRLAETVKIALAKAGANGGIPGSPTPFILSPSTLVPK